MDLKLELFNFQKGLDYETQAEIANVVRAHFENVETSSEMRLIKSLNEQLNDYKYDKEVVGFLGPNGAGKSTTMKMLTGFLEPDGGEIFIEGIDLKTNL